MLSDEYLIASSLPPSLDDDTYAELTHLISHQFVKRVIAVNFLA